MTGHHQKRRPGHGAYSAEERGRRILWRTVTIGLYAGLGIFAIWLAAWLRWPFKLTLALIAIPYWTLVIALWMWRGPYLPRQSRRSPADDPG